MLDVGTLAEMGRMRFRWSTLRDLQSQKKISAGNQFRFPEAEFPLLDMGHALLKNAQSSWRGRIPASAD